MSSVCTAQKTQTLVHYVDQVVKNFETITNLIHKYLCSYNIKILYMFRALLCSSSGGTILYVQHLVPSLSVSGRTCGRSQTVTLPDAVHVQMNLLKMNKIMLETCRGF